LIPGLGLHDGELGVAIDEDVIGDERLATPPVAFEAAWCDRVFTPDTAALNEAPARRFERGINVLGSSG
jgi:hypothetical protein